MIPRLQQVVYGRFERSNPSRSNASSRGHFLPSWPGQDGLCVFLSRYPCLTKQNRLLSIPLLLYNSRSIPFTFALTFIEPNTTYCNLSYLVVVMVLGYPINVILLQFLPIKLGVGTSIFHAVHRCVLYEVIAF